VSQVRTLQKRIGKWQAKTFGPIQSIQSVDAHMVKEVGELLDAPTPEDQAPEMADIVILLMGRATLMGIDLLAEVEKKFAINQTRTWGQPDAQGIIEHKR
jgi:NTP pyrophosphatase (non-canonical NTP hydrolase)